jgi:hypothetical protein
MASQTIQFLESHADDPRFGRVIEEVLEFIGSSPILHEDCPTPPGVPAQEIADIHAFRKRAGLYKLAAVTGLDETIESLRNCGSLVRGKVIETGRGYVAIFLGEGNALVGAMIFRKEVQFKS